MEAFEGIKGWVSLGAALGITSVGLIFIAVACLIWRRTKSTHSLMTRIWIWFDRNSKNSDEAIATFLNGQTNLMQFRFTTGVQARTISQAHRLINWVNSHDENIDAVKGCGEYFDVELPGLKGVEDLPGKPKQAFISLVFILFFLIASLSAFGAIQNSAILRTKDTGITFLLSPENAVLLWSNTSFGDAQCKADRSKIEKSTGLKGFEVDAICKLFASEIASDYVRDNVRFQRVVLPFISVPLAIVALASFGYFMCGARANAMAHRIGKRKKLAIDPVDNNLKGSLS